MNHRRTTGTMAAVMTIALAACSATPSEDGATVAEDQETLLAESLVFPVEDYTEETTTVTTSEGEVEVTYRFYDAITYVTNPVDADYQSLTVSVPVEIDGVAVDATDAPILFDITVGGYMSSSVTGASSGDPGAAPEDAAIDDEASGDSVAAPEEDAGGPPDGEMPSGEPPEGMTPPDGAAEGEMPAGGVPGGGGAFEGQGGSGNSELALAAGYVVVTPGARGRDNQAEDGTYYGKAPAAIVDLKAALRYVHANAGVIPGDTDLIVTTGTSAGGALSALLGASADSDLYDEYLAELGAAEASDAVYAVAAYCPITDLENADGAYEWLYGAVGNEDDAESSAELVALFTEYQASLGLEGADGFGELTADTLGDYLLRAYLEPSATAYLTALSEADRESYLAENTWITWSDGAATFTLADFVEHVGRSKSLPAFDALDLSSAETVLFGDETTDARHFTEFSLREATGDDTAEVEADVQEAVTLMNPMTFLSQDDANPGRATNWWLRVGTSDTDTTLTVLTNLATSLENLGDDVDASMYWDAGHGANEDAEDFIAWIGAITGYGS